MATINTSFFQLVAAFFVGFILAHMATKYFDKFERFPSPLVTPVPEYQFPIAVQGRDYIPYRALPTVPPGPVQPLAMQTDAKLYPPVPPTTQQPAVSSTPWVAQVTPPEATPTLVPQMQQTAMPYAMTNDDYRAFLT